MTTVLQVLASTRRRGAEIFATDLGMRLRTLGLDVEDVALCTGSSGGPHLDVPVLGPSPMAPRTLRSLRRLVAKASIVVGHGSHTLPACALASVRTNTPFVYRSIGDPRYWANSRLRQLRVRVLLGRARGLVVLWPGALPIAVERHGVPPQKVRVIPNGVPADRFPLVDSRRRAAARARLGLCAEQVVVSMGSLTPEKRVDLAIRAIAAIPDTVLVIFGEGAERPALERLAADLAPGRVRFAGPLVEPALGLAAADVFVLPSDTEGVPAVLIEAGLSGVPVVATAVGGVPDVVVSGVTGLLVPRGDGEALAGAIRWTLRNGDGVATAARAHCLQQFEIGTVATQWKTFLTQLAREAQP